MKKKFLNLRELASYLRISIPTLWRLRTRRADFPTPVKLSNQTILFVEEEINAWVESAESRGA